MLVRDDSGVAADPDAILRVIELLDLGHQDIDVDVGAGRQNDIRVPVDATYGKLSQDALAAISVIRGVARVRPSDPDHRNRIG